MRAFFVASLLILAPCGAALHADESRPADPSLAGPRLAMSGPQADAQAPVPLPGVPVSPNAKVPDPRDSQKPGDSAADPAKEPAAKNGLAGKAEPDRAKRMDALFAALKAAPTKESAKSIADRIDVALIPADSDTADLLMSRAAIAAEAKQYDLAIELLDSVLVIAPDHLEAWNKRATVFYLKDDYADALADLRQVLAREPRHYGAWAGIALICKEIGDNKRALEAARQALAIYPFLDQIDDMEKSLALEVEGRPI
ncbi:tetratricopeptide repeat protein [Ancylobacter terrae]|uniref:tetratricopeptide repeat protein n=1 Tax=Ancylobacter sp. sgz301288 TaxID=3342077 RepID=UPI00385FC08D